jgi:hypothetical protein
VTISSGVHAKNKDLSAIQLAALGLCTFAFVVIGGLMVLKASGRIGHQAADPPAVIAAQAR